MKFLVLIVSLGCMAPLATANVNGLQCFVPGECIDSLMLDITINDTINDAQKCHEKCKEVRLIQGVKCPSFIIPYIPGGRVRVVHLLLDFQALP
jgi:hypothetical protein